MDGHKSDNNQNNLEYYSKTKRSRDPLGALGDFIIKIGKSIAGFFKHLFSILFSKKNRKITILIIAAIIIIPIVIVILNLTIWKPTVSEPDTISYEEWMQELESIRHEAYQMEDDAEADAFYQEKISNTEDESKKIDIRIFYIRDTARRGFTNNARDMLDEMNINDLTCEQEVDYYSAYRYTYVVDGDEYQAEEYGDKSVAAIERCGLGGRE